MTREEAITVLKGLSENPLFSNQHKAAFNIAIHDIKQRHDWDINNLILINKDNYEPLEQEPRTGHWIKISHAEIYECSECGQNVMTSDICVYKFCHGCGAKMVEP